MEFALSVPHVAPLDSPIGRWDRRCRVCSDTTGRWNTIPPLIQVESTGGTDVFARIVLDVLGKMPGFLPKELSSEGVGGKHVGGNPRLGNLVQDPLCRSDSVADLFGDRC